MTMGKDALNNVSRKHQLIEGSFTEAELVSIFDVLLVMMWSKSFMGAQGYMIENNVLYQDDTSTILLAKENHMLAGKRSKYIKNRFFLVTDEIAQDELTVQYCLWNNLEYDQLRNNHVPRVVFFQVFVG